MALVWGALQRDRLPLSYRLRCRWCLALSPQAPSVVRARVLAEAAGWVVVVRLGGRRGRALDDLFPVGECPDCRRSHSAHFAARSAGGVVPGVEDAGQYRSV